MISDRTQQRDVIPNEVRDLIIQITARPFVSLRMTKENSITE